VLPPVPPDKNTLFGGWTENRRKQKKSGRVKINPKEEREKEKRVFSLFKPFVKDFFLNKKILFCTLVGKVSIFL